MQDFNAYETTMSMWYDLMQGAQAHGECYLQEAVESYVVFVLMRFTQRPELADVVLAEDFFRASEKEGALQHEQMRDVADGCLLYAGFFPDRSTRKNVSEQYFLDLGRMAYRSLSVLPERVWTGPYNEMEETIADAARVLSYINQVQ